MVLWQPQRQPAYLYLCQKMQKETIKKMPVRYKSLADGADAAFKCESSIDKILSHGNYTVEIEHNGENVGLPVEYCGTEHYIVGTLVVTDSGTMRSGNGNRAIGQELTITLRHEKETKVFTRTFAAGTWSEWHTFAPTAMCEKIADDLDAVEQSLHHTIINYNEWKATDAQLSLPNLLADAELVKMVKSGTILTFKNTATTWKRYQYTAASTAVANVKSFSNWKELSAATYSIKQAADANKVQISTTGENGGVKDILNISAATTELAGVMSAEDKKNLNDNIAAIATEVARAKENENQLADSIGNLYERRYYDFSTIGASLGFHNTQNKVVGDAFNDYLYSSTTKYAASKDVKAGSRVKLCTYVTSANKGAARPWVLVDADKIIVDISEALNNYDYTDGVEIEVLQDAKLYVACDTGYEDIFSLEIKRGVIDDLQEKIVVLESKEIKTTNSSSLYLPNKTVILAGASISSRNGYFEYAMKRLGLVGKNVSVAGNNILHLCYLLYKNSYADQDALIISHLHNYDIYSLPESHKNNTSAEYETDAVLAPYLTTNQYVSGNITPPEGYTEDEIYAIGYDYAIKKWIEKCYNLRSTDGYDAIAGKNCQIILTTYWHDGRTVYNNAVRKLAKKWGLPLIKEDENIGFSKDSVHPITGKQWSVLYCNGVPWSTKTEVINGVTYGFHPSGIASADWDSFIEADAETMLQMLPDIQKRRAAIIIDYFKKSLV